MITNTTSVATFPRALLLAIGAMLLLVLLSVTTVRVSGIDIRTPDAPAVALRELRFEDRPDGSIAVIDATNERLVHSVTGESGFVRGTLRGLARDRKRQGFGAERPFELIGRADGRLTLVDPVTGRIVDLESFGPVNASAFAQLMRADGSTQ